MLLLLARLYPSTFDDGGDPSMSLKPFVPLVLRYGEVWGNLVRGNLDRRDYGKKQFVRSYINTKYCKMTFTSQIFLCCVWYYVLAEITNKLQFIVNHW